MGVKQGDHLLGREREMADGFEEPAVVLGTKGGQAQFPH